LKDQKKEEKEVESNPINLEEHEKLLIEYEEINKT